MAAHRIPLRRDDREALLNRSQEWRDRASREDDPFNKYFSLWLAFNVFYSLLWKTIRGGNDMIRKDAEAATLTMTLVSEPRLLLQELQPVFSDCLTIIPVFREEYWPSNKSSYRVPISESMKRAVEGGDSQTALEMLVKWLYKVRCNLVHGEKGYNDEGQH